MASGHLDSVEKHQIISLHGAMTDNAATLHTRQRHACSFSFISCISMAIVLLSLIFFMSDEGWSKIGPTLKEMALSSLYHLQRRWNTQSAFELFAAQDPIFTQTLDDTVLQKLLTDRRRLRGGVFENTLVAACSDSSAILSTTLLSWNRVRQVRELVIVDYDSTLEGPMTSLQLVNSIDKLGRVLFVTAGSRRPLRKDGASKRIGRARALNLGVAMASGKNVAVVGCNTKISPWLLSEHPLSNGTFYTGSSHQATVGDNAEYNVMYMKKSAFVAVGGFDERIDISGCEFRDLKTRLAHQQRLRRLSMDRQMIQPLRYDQEESIMLLEDSGVVDAGDVMKRARMIPELSSYIFTLAREQLPHWTGLHTDGTHTMLSLGALQFTVLRRQVESAEHGSRTTGGSLVSSDADYRLWVQVRVQGKNPAFMLDLLPKKQLHYVLLNAHRKLLHNDYKLPRGLLQMVESEFKGSSYSAVGGGPEEEEEKVAVGRIMNYVPLVFEVVLRKKRIVVVKVEVEEAMELFMGISWAIGFAILKDRALILVGRIAETPINQVLDYDGMADVLHREYNLKVKIIGGGGDWECRRGQDGGCWDGDVMGGVWGEYNLTGEPTEVKDETVRHKVLNVESARIERWEGTGNGSRLQGRLQRLAFASICVSREVGERIERSVSRELREESEESVAVVVSKKRRRLGEIRKVAEMIEKAMGKRARRVFVSGEKWSTVRDMVEKLRGRAEMMRGVRDGVGRVGELWMVMKCERIVFEEEEMVGAWRGGVVNVAGWRRVHVDDGSDGATVRASRSGVHVISFS